MRKKQEKKGIKSENAYAFEKDGDDENAAASDVGDAEANVDEDFK